MFKGAFFLIIFLCYAKCSFTAPPPAEGQESATSTTTEKESIFQRIKNKVKSFFQPVTDWVSKLFKGLLLPFKMLGGLTLRLELAAIAIDEHLAFPQQQLRQEDQIEHKSAKAIVILWQRLPTMIKTDKILVNVTESLIGTAIVESDNATKTLFEHLEQKFKEDPPLYAEFVEIRAKIKDENATSNSTTAAHGSMAKKIDTDGESEAIENFLRLPEIRKLIYNKRFILDSKKNKAIKDDELLREFYALTQAIISLAQKPEFAAKLQTIYEEVVAETAKNFDPIEKLAEGSVELVKGLEKRIDSDADLKPKIDAIKKELIAKSDSNFEYINDFEKYLVL